MRTLFITLSLLTIINAQIIHVPSQYSTIQAAIDTVPDNWTILVQGGVYYENLVFYSPSFDLICDNTFGECVIDGGGVGRVIDIYPCSEYEIIIDGFTIQNGFTEEEVGGGIMIRHCSLILNNSIVVNNQGGGIYYWQCGSVLEEINNCLIRDNHFNAILAYNSTITINNSTVVNNSQNSDASIFISISSGINISNSILWELENNIYLFEGGELEINYSNIKNGINSILTEYDYEIIWGEGNINEDPQFVDIETEDYHLMYNSPCIDRGNPDLDGDNIDFDGLDNIWGNNDDDVDDQDPDGTRMDMGAFYFNQKLGDLNGDQSIDLEDIFMMVDYILGELDYADTSIPTADLNDDNIINIVDLLILVFNILLEETLPNQNSLPIYFSGFIEEMEDGQYRYSIDMLNENDVNALFLKGQFQDKLVVNLNKGDRLTEMDLDYRYFSDGTSVNILIYSISGRKIPAGSGSILELELVSNGGLNRDGDLTDGEEFLDIGAANNFTELIPVEVVTSDEMGKLIEQKKNIPVKFNAQLSPNPFNPVLKIHLDIEQEGQYSIQIFDIKGQFVKSVHNGYLSASTSQFKWDASNYSSGIYFVNIQSDKALTNNKVILLK